MGLEGGGEGCELPEKLRTCCSLLLLCVKNCTAVRAIFFTRFFIRHRNTFRLSFDCVWFLHVQIDVHKNYLYVHIYILDAKATCSSESSKVCIFWPFTTSRVKWIIIMGTFISCASFMTLSCFFKRELFEH